MKITRRQVLVSGAAVGGGLVLGAFMVDGDVRKQARKIHGEDGEFFLHTWIRVANDGTVTVLVPHSEMGQGVHTSLPMMLAEEMDADWEKVRMEQAPAHPTFANPSLPRGFILPGDVPGLFNDMVDYATLKTAQLMNLQLTGGSTSLRYTGRYGMRQAGAAARWMLAKAASKRWQVPQAEIEVAQSILSHPATGKELGFGDLAAEASTLDPPNKLELKSPADYSIVGQSKPRVDIPDKVVGKPVYGIDVEPEGLRYAAVAHIPVFGGAVRSYDASKALAEPGVETVVEVEGGIAVIAEKYWTAQKALRALEIEWDDGGNGEVSSEDILRRQVADIEGGELDVDREEGDAEGALAAAANRVEATYSVPYLAHAAMEPLNCTAWVRPDGCDVWAGVQNLLAARAQAADVTGLDPDTIDVHPVMLGGGFGRRGMFSLDYIRQGVDIARQVPYPVKMIWSREDDMRHDAYRPAITARLTAALDDSGSPSAWLNDHIGKNEPSEAAHIPYAIANTRIRYGEDPTHVPFGTWRSVAHSQHAFFTESFFDEVATAGGRDPYELRRELLADRPDMVAVLDAAAKSADWGSPLPEGSGRGIAIVESFGSIVAEVAEVTVDPESGVKVDRIVCAADTGEVIHPDGLTAQLESGIIFALSAALYGEITIKNGRVVERNFPDYPMMKMADTPVIETVLVPSGRPIGGAGEVATPPVAPAVANALFAATGRRVRELPLRKAGLA